MGLHMNLPNIHAPFPLAERVPADFMAAWGMEVDVAEAVVEFAVVLDDGQAPTPHAGRAATTPTRRPPVASPPSIKAAWAQAKRDGPRLPGGVRRTPEFWL